MLYLLILYLLDLSVRFHWLPIVLVVSQQTVLFSTYFPDLNCIISFFSASSPQRFVSSTFLIVSPSCPDLTYTSLSLHCEYKDFKTTLFLLFRYFLLSTSVVVSNSIANRRNEEVQDHHTSDVNDGQASGQQVYQNVNVVNQHSPN